MDINVNLVPKEEFFDQVLKIVIFVCGIFQLFCIFSVFFISDKSSQVSSSVIQPLQEKCVAEGGEALPFPKKKIGKAKHLRKRK